MSPNSPIAQQFGERSKMELIGLMALPFSCPLSLSSGQCRDTTLLSIFPRSAVMPTLHLLEPLFSHPVWVELWAGHCNLSLLILSPISLQCWMQINHGPDIASKYFLKRQR